MRNLPSRKRQLAKIANLEKQLEEAKDNLEFYDRIRGTKAASPPRDIKHRMSQRMRQFILYLDIHPKPYNVDVADYALNNGYANQVRGAINDFINYHGYADKSIQRMCRILEERSLIQRDNSNCFTLTDKGKELAKIIEKEFHPDYIKEKR